MFEQNVFQGPGTGTFTTHTFEILFMLGVMFLLGLWLGWVLWSRFRQEAERLRIENVSLDATATTLRTEQESLKNKLAEAESGYASLESQVQSLNWDSENLRNQLTVLQSDLEKVQARNRQLESEFGMAHEPEAGAHSLEIPAPLPSRPLDGDLPDLEASIADPENLSQTPALDAEPQLAALKENADAGAAAIPSPIFIAPVAEEHLEEGIAEAEEPVAQKTPAKPAEQEPSVIAAVTTGPHDDLKIVEGIGPKIEEVLFQAGITTYGQLAATGVQQIKNILADAGPRFVVHDPGTWPSQALLAANGEWAELKAYQEFLHQGKRPDK
ncbi:MAG: hypothetical protein JNK89_03800 [Saprospiraceae bacterium]|nr:hypothetical protein [Saprospiraceae bacterium]